MRDLKKEISYVREILATKTVCCPRGNCLICPAYYWKESHVKLFGVNDANDNEEYRASKRRWLRGWLSLATGKPVKE